MKKVLKKSLVLLLALMLAVSCFVACDNNGGETTDEVRVFYSANLTTKDKTEIQKHLDRMASLAEFPIKWEAAGVDQLQLAFNSGDIPDTIITPTLSSINVVKYASNDLLVPLDEYINEKDTPNIYKMFQDYPTAKGLATLDDGHIYALPSVGDITPTFFESAFFINKAWLDKLGLQIPKTFDDLYEVLKAFKTGDPNGNGKADEIPVSFYNNAGYSYPEVLLSGYGISAKHGTWDQFLTVNDGKVDFAPVREEFKNLIKFYRKLYAEGLLDMECFTQDQATFDAKAQSKVSQVGFLWTNSNMMGNPDEYVAIPPLTAEGAAPKLHIHPGAITKATLNNFVITTACENPQTVMKWIDKFYTVEETLQNYYGNAGTSIEKDENGMYRFLEPAEGLSQGQMIQNNKLTNVPTLLREEYLDKYIEKTDFEKEAYEMFEIYRPYINDEVWPRPYYGLNEIDEISTLTTDLFRLVEEKKAKWVVGKADIDAEWDTYIKDLKAMGLDRLIEISQSAYDRYLKNQK